MPTQQESNTSVLTELYKYAPSAIIELFELDLTPLNSYYTDKGQPISTLKYYFHNGTNQRAEGTPPLTNIDVVWGAGAGNTYSARSIQIEGIQASTAGEIPRPTLTISNHDLFFTEINKSYAGLVGAKITRTRTLVKFLNASNFLSGINPTADPNAKFPDDVFNIDRISEEVPGQITFELAPAWDVEGVLLPRRQIIANICPWEYKQDPCTWRVEEGSAVGNGGVTKIKNITGTGVSVASTAIWRGRVPVNITGSGIKLVARVTRYTAGTSYSNATHTKIEITRSGSGYAVNSQLKILGTDLGGASPANDLTFQIDSVNNVPYYNENDIIVTDAAQDRCGKRYTSCRIRFGTRAMPFGGFPSAGLYGKPI